MGPCLNGHRTLIDIIKSCYSVIVVSIWASIHPNVPDVAYVCPETGIGSLLDQAIIMVVAFLAPELIMLWAMRQRFMAKRVAKKFEKYGWTKAHGFLCIMKGIALYDQKGFLCYLQYPKNHRDQKEQDIIRKIDAILRPDNGDSPDFREPPQATQTAISQALSTTYTFAATCPSVRRIETGASPTATTTSPTERPSPSTSGLRQREPASIQIRDESSGVATDVVCPTGSSGARDDNRDPQLEKRLSTVPAHYRGTWNDVKEIGQRLNNYLVIRSYPLPDLLEYLLEKGLVDISETDIADTLNHGDTFSKLILISQTAWFASKMIGRISTMLYVTELEIVALTSVLLSFVAQACWWGKPQRVRHPYKVMLPIPIKRIPAFCAETSCNAHHESDFWGRLYSEFSHLWKRLCADFQGARSIYPRVPKPAFVVGYPLYLLAAEITALLEADNFDDGSTDAKEGTFDFLFSCGIDVGSTPKRIYGALSSISVLVGMFHFGAWRSTIFSPKEHLWWRLGTVFVTVLPVILATTYFCLGSQEQCKEERSGSRGKRILHVLMRGFFNLSVWLYLAARFALIVIALVELSRLQDNPSAFCDVEIGLSFHIG
ncbi:hypothetical protein AAF712_007052 [Marasmius tenuissimus]|uniref:Cyclic nucleotide-binding domain-containing protein n=1 Tax=Marasmius tenuissimus TaxID=585030 RepID=A0ABR2ZXW8_9AGAR